MKKHTPFFCVKNRSNFARTFLPADIVVLILNKLMFFYFSVKK